jgi:GNAT superfamily N-acetyltransferase
MVFTMHIGNYICKIASIEEMEQKWDYEISQHSEKRNWIVWKDEAIESARTGLSIPYYGILDGTVICEATAVLNPGFEQACGKPDHTVELCAFRTNKEYRGKGYFSKLMIFLQEDLKEKGYTKAAVGVEPKEKRNREIYRHWGFTEDFATGTETYPDGTVIQVEFLGKTL